VLVVLVLMLLPLLVLLVLPLVQAVAAADSFDSQVDGVPTSSDHWLLTEQVIPAAHSLCNTAVNSLCNPCSELLM